MKRDLTIEGALKEAQRRWGLRAQLRVEMGAARIVGVTSKGFGLFHEKGRGTSWREAFAAVDSNAWRESVGLKPAVVEVPR